MVNKVSPLYQPAEYYRTFAADIRARAPFVKSQEARNELYALATEYERLAVYVEANPEASADRSSPQAKD